MLNEINDSFALGNYFSVAMLSRSVNKSLFHQFLDLTLLIK